ncbi:MAG: hypothetical protein ACLRWQ_18475 [Flavonifractor plautii]
MRLRRKHHAGRREGLHGHGDLGRYPGRRGGECFDKVARVLGIGYPGGAPMDALAQGGDDRRYELPAPTWPTRRWICPFRASRQRCSIWLHNAAQEGER